jgi:aldehyde dehydrogenase (NAD+)
VSETTTETSTNGGAAAPEAEAQAQAPAGGNGAGASAPARAPIRWDYSPAPESTDHVRLRDRYGLFIGGQFVEPADGGYAPTINPATEEPLAEIAQAGATDVRRAVAAAREAAAGWAALPGLERGKYVFRIARLIQERARELAVVETLDGGKPIKESRDVDVPLAAAHFFYYAGWADKLEYGIPAPPTRGAVRPRGVVGQVIPWNFPLLMAAWKLAPALATGNTAVLKPADTTPLTALLLAEILQEAELPDGVVNILPGDGSAGAALVRSDVDKVAFTGSTAVGRDIQAALAGKDIGLTLELGGKSANIVFEDAAIDQAVEGIVQGIFFNQGHVCCAGSRLLVQESVAEQVIDRLWARMQNLRVGDPLDKNTDVGAINSAAQLRRIGELVEAGVEEGAGLRQVSCALPSKGFWFAPALFTEASPAHRIAREEIFGPVLAVTTFRTHAEAIEKANNSAYGLAAGIWTDKGSKAFEVASQLRAGVIWQNTYNHFDPTAAFGGFKESGFGREGGAIGLRPYVKVEA